MTINNEIQAALENTLAGVTDVPECVFDAVEFTPTLGSPYVRASVVPGSERPATAGVSPLILREGLFEIAVVYPSGKGMGEAVAMADNIRDAYPVDETLTSGGTKLRISYAERRPHLIDTEWIRIPVSVGWYVFTD